MSIRYLWIDLIYGTADATTASTLGIPEGMTTKEAKRSKAKMEQTTHLILMILVDLNYTYIWRQTITTVEV